jgi:hypothetical protein
VKHIAAMQKERAARQVAAVKILKGLLMKVNRAIIAQRQSSLNVIFIY